jgi:D-alanine--poly(phosphoribitol) ligase subunit 1
VMDCICSLATGGTLFSISRDLIANQELYRALTSSSVTTWVSTPSFAQMSRRRQIFRRDAAARAAFSLWWETLPPQTAAQLLKRFPKQRFGTCMALLRRPSPRRPYALMLRF